MDTGPGFNTDHRNHADSHTHSNSPADGCRHASVGGCDSFRDRDPTIPHADTGTSGKRDALTRAKRVA
jgi:hypothetical protein